MSFKLPLSSFTSGIAGSSEGGRINTMRLMDALGIYGVALVDRIRKSGYKGKVSAQPETVDGLWGFKVEFEGEEPPAVPELWYGRRLVVAKKAAPPASGASS